MVDEHSEKNVEKPGSLKDTLESASRESTAGKANLVEKQRKDLAYQKSEDRPPGDASRALGRPSIVDDTGAVLVSGKKAHSDNASNQIHAFEQAAGKASGKAETAVNAIVDQSKKSFNQKDFGQLIDGLKSAGDRQPYPDFYAKVLKPLSEELKGTLPRVQEGGITKPLQIMGTTSDARHSGIVLTTDTPDGQSKHVYVLEKDGSYREAGRTEKGWVTREGGQKYEMGSDGQLQLKKETGDGKPPESNYKVTINPDGSSTTIDEHGNISIMRPDGGFRQENKDGTGYERLLQADHTCKEKHWGPRPDQNYELNQQPDNSLKGVDPAGRTHTKWGDTEKISYPDGRACTLVPDGVGGRIENHSGPRQQDSFDLSRNSDGSIKISEKAGDKPYESINDPKIKAERDRLSHLAEQKITDPEELDRFQADMARFEDRSRKIEADFKTEGWKPADAAEKAHAEVTKTYAQISRLLEAGDNPRIPLDAKQRTQIAEQIMSHAATPTSIDQGQHNTCNVTTVEVRTYSKDPSAAARLVVDAATMGEYTSKNNHKVTLVPGDLAPHDEAKTNPPSEGARGLASQLFEITAVNIHYQSVTPDIHYRQREPGAMPDPGDTGERLVDYSTHPPTNTGKQPGLGSDQIVNIGNEITGRTEYNWYLQHKEYGGTNTVGIESEKSLQDAVAQARDNGKLPVTIMVHTGNEPFLTDSGAGAAGGSGGWHVVNITDYAAGPPARVAIDNQWGAGADHTGKNMVSVQELYMSMRNPAEPGCLADMKKQVEDNRARGIVDDYKELEYLRLQNKSGKLSAEDYQKQLEDRIRDLNKHEHDQKASRTFDIDSSFRINGKLEALVRNLPPEQKLSTLHLERSLGRIDGASYDWQVAQAFVAIKKQLREDIKNDRYQGDRKQHYDNLNYEFRAITGELPPERRESIQAQVRAALPPPSPIPIPVSD